ncbi:TIGR04086 family membrane protein [Bacillus sp. FJAT-47783]|uniref:TIGR04086 family membrane protein n=1 Tax=Bacillus sp. FJAT-47783 TaxID=2922712 RepID=UPI001FACB878|nr:TIGR04086 family membrane protein [Bacillus sp. FJAT-47783]
MIESKRWGSAILYGVTAILLIALVVSLLFSLLLKFTSLTEQSIQWLIITLAFISVFIGGIVAGRKGKEKGLLLGALTALTYTGIVLLFQFLGYGQSLSGKNWLYHGGFLLVAMLGGVIGVNLSSSKRQS